MKDNEEARLKTMLRQAIPAVDEQPAPSRDLWPDMLRRIDAEPSPSTHHGWIWFDCALLAGLVGMAAFFPAAIPVFLYYL